MDKSLAAFEQLIGEQLLISTPIVLLFTKMDVFADMIQQLPLHSVYPECPISADLDASSNFLAATFAKLDQRPEGKLQICVTNAVDKAVFEKTLHELRPMMTSSIKKTFPKKRESLEQRRVIIPVSILPMSSDLLL